MSGRACFNQAPMKLFQPFAAVLMLAGACSGADTNEPADGGNSGVNVDGAVKDAAADPAEDASNEDPEGGSAQDAVSLPEDAAGSESEASLPTLGMPEPNAGFDYQLGGAYAPSPGVRIVSRDRNEATAPGLYNICYVNGYQAQENEASFWLDQHPDLVLRDGSGKPVIDPDWNEMLLDITTAAKRQELAMIVGGFIEGCASAGFDAVEIDNLDTYTRSGGRISEDDAVAFMQMLAQIAHAHGLAIAQKNSAELVGRKGEMGTDFVVAEECNRYSECGDYTAAYGDAVLVIEYRRQDFDKGCKDFPQLSIVLRDRDLVPAGAAGYVYAGC